MSTYDDDNRPRFGAARGGHVESWFVRANDPRAPRAIWLKATVLRPLQGAPVAEAWCCTFDSDGAFGVRGTAPLEEARFEGDPLQIEVAGCQFTLGRDGGSGRGALAGPRGTARWDLSWTALGGRIGEPMCLYPTRRMVDSGFPKNKLLTPAPAVRFDGRFEHDGTLTPVRGWAGMQGHNWGPAHAPAYAWGQCWFPGTDGGPATVVEGASGRLKLGPVLTPWIAGMVVRRGGASYRFDRMVDLWARETSVGDLAWRVRLRSGAGEAELSMDADPRQTVCLGYRNPDGALSYCFNSKIGRARLRVTPREGAPFTVTSAHGAALEILTRTPDPRFGTPV